MRWFASFAAVSMLAGCSFFVSLDDLSSGDAGGGGNDASSDVTTLDGSAKDGASTNDASVDGSSRFCPQPGVFLCADFDDDDIDAALLSPGWDYVTGSSQAISTAQFVSAPRSLELRTDSLSEVSYVAKDVIGTHLVSSFELYVADFGGNNAAAFFDVSGIGGIYLQMGSGGTDILESYSYSDGGTAYGSSSGPPFPTGAWHQVDFEVDLVKETADLRIDGTQTIHRDFDSSSWATATGAGVGIGMVATISGDMFYDNVTFTKK